MIFPIYVQDLLRRQLGELLGRGGRRRRGERGEGQGRRQGQGGGGGGAGQGAGRPRAGKQGVGGETHVVVHSRVGKVYKSTLDLMLPSAGRKGNQG